MPQGRSIFRTQLQVDTLLEEFRLQHQPRFKDLPREIGEILSHINESLFDSELNVKRLKSDCRLRDNNISSRFRYVMGMTIKEYIEDLRLEAAERLLREDTLSVFDVAASVGYYHPQTFYRAFQRRYDCTPAEYRGHASPSVLNAD